MATTSRITIDVTTDENQVPVAMEWTAEDGGVLNPARICHGPVHVGTPRSMPPVRMDL